MVAQSDKTAFGLILTVILCTIIWVAVFSWRSFRPRGSSRPRRARKSVAIGELRRRSTFTSTTDGRLQFLFSDAKEMLSRTQLATLQSNARTAMTIEADAKASTMWWILILSLRERFDRLLLKKARNQFESSDESEALSSWIASAEQLKIDIDEVETDDQSHSADVCEAFEAICARIMDIADECDIENRMTWTRESAPLLELESRLHKRQLFSGEHFHLDEKREQFAAQDQLESRTQRLVRQYVSVRIRQYPWFYGAFIVACVAIFLSHIGYTDSGKVRGTTFLSINPAYDLQNVKHQAILVPVIYGIMHNVLFCFGLLPLAMLRGLHRDLLRRFPRIRGLIPFDDMTYVHELWGVMAIGGILLAGFIWVVILGVTCMDDCATGQINGVGATSQQRACSAFNPTIRDAKRGDPNSDPNDELLFDSIPGGSYLDPRDNVLFLRELVWILWFFGMPLIYWARRTPRYLPLFVRRNWFEFCYYIHLYGAIVSIVLALYARFEVFYPMLLGGWTLFFIEKIREAIWYTYDTEILVNAFQPRNSSTQITAGTGQPTVLALNIRKPPRFAEGMEGQWLHVQVPSIDKCWHAFSLSSASPDKHVQLLVGIQGAFSDQRGPNGEWIQPPSTQTWTYKLLSKFRLAAADSLSLHKARNIPCKLRGPYGSPFSKCFNPKYPAVVVIGAGTGLTSALSVLKEMVHRRKMGRSTQHVWFVWSCRQVDDLLLCWRALHELLFDAFQHGAVRLSNDWNPLTCVMLDWLSVIIYVTRSDRMRLIEFLEAETSASLPDAASVTGAKTAAPMPPPPPQQQQQTSSSDPVSDIDKLENEILSSSSTGSSMKAGRPSNGLVQRKWRLAANKVAPMRQSIFARVALVCDLLAIKQNQGIPGDFVARKSDSSPDGIILSVLLDPNSNSFEHHILDKKGNGFLFDGKPMDAKLTTLESVIRHLALDSDLVTVPLRLPLSKDEDGTSGISYMKHTARNILMIPSSDSTQREIEELFQTDSSKPASATIQDISTWMKEQVLETSMDSKSAHIGNVFQWVREFTADPYNKVPGGGECPIAICFCGPSPLAQVIGEAAAVVGGSMEYSSEHQ
eukprot:m.161933 g.161933  ORF g.161933 m.161933 type:complete len:1086 (+) comp10294_c0_seq1:183-3440(+)